MDLIERCADSHLCKRSFHFRFQWAHHYVIIEQSSKTLHHAIQMHKWSPRSPQLDFWHEQALHQRLPVILILVSSDMYMMHMASEAEKVRCAHTERIDHPSPALEEDYNRCTLQVYGLRRLSVVDNLDI